MECNNEIQVNLSIHIGVFLTPDSASHKLPSHKQNNTIFIFTIKTSSSKKQLFISLLRSHSSTCRFICVVNILFCSRMS